MSSPPNDTEDLVLPLPIDPPGQDAFCEEITSRLAYAGISQSQFATMCKLEAESMITSGKMTYEQLSDLNFSQASYSRVLSGERRYDRMLVFLWLRVLQKWYLSDHCIYVYRSRYNTLPPPFTHEDIVRLLSVAGFNSEEERRSAIARTTEKRAIVLVEPISDSFQNSILGKRRKRNQ